MLTQNNMNALNDVPVKAKDLNPHLFVGVEDPVIREFLNEHQEFLKVAVWTVFMYIAYSAVLLFFGWSVTTLWPFINEWIEIICMVSSTAVTAMFLKWIHDETEEADTYIVKLKAKLAAKDAIIAELELKLNYNDSDNNYNDSDNNDSDNNDSDNNDSDYDPDLDEY